MAYVIGNDCVSCGSCEGNCPVSAISQGDEHYVIDADACIDCGTCAETCPVGCHLPGLMYSDEKRRRRTTAPLFFSLNQE